MCSELWIPSRTGLTIQYCVLCAWLNFFYDYTRLNTYSSTKNNCHFVQKMYYIQCVGAYIFHGLYIKMEEEGWRRSSENPLILVYSKSHPVTWRRRFMTYPATSGWLLGSFHVVHLNIQVFMAEMRVCTTTIVLRCIIKESKWLLNWEEDWWRRGQSLRKNHSPFQMWHWEGWESEQGSWAVKYCH